MGLLPLPDDDEPAEEGETEPEPEEPQPPLPPAAPRNISVLFAPRAAVAAAELPPEATAAMVFPTVMAMAAAVMPEELILPP